MDIDCVIIEDVKECVLFGRRLPIGIKRIYGQQIAEKTIIRDDGELTAVAHSRLSRLRVMSLSDAQLLRMRTYGDFNDNGYKMTSVMTLLRDVGEERSLEK